MLNRLYLHQSVLDPGLEAIRLKCLARKACLERNLQVQREQQQKGTLHGFRNASARLLACRCALREKIKMKDDAIECSNMVIDKTGIQEGVHLSQWDGQVDGSEQRPKPASRTAVQPAHNIPQVPVFQDCSQSLSNTLEQSHPPSRDSSSEGLINRKYQKYLEDLDQVMHTALSHEFRSGERSNPAAREILAERMVAATQKLRLDDQQDPVNQEYGVATQLQQSTETQQNHNTRLNLVRQSSIDRWTEAARSPGDQNAPLNQDHHVETQLPRPTKVYYGQYTGLDLVKQASLDRWVEAARSATIYPEPIRAERRHVPRQAPARVEPWNHRAPGCQSPNNGGKKFGMKNISPEDLYHLLLKAYSKGGSIPDRCVPPVPSYGETSTGNHP